MFENLLAWSPSQSYIPHGTCLIWNAPLIWLHVVSDALTAASYYSIPFALGYFVHRRTDLAYRWVFILFAVFILACGSTHLMDIWTLWHPDYLAQGFIKLATAATSTATAALLWPLLPKVLRLPSPSQLSHANERLLEEVRRHEQTVANLRVEAAERRMLEYKLRKSEAKLKAILDTAADGIITINEESLIETCNPAAARMLGYQVDEIIGEKVNKLMPFPEALKHDHYIAAYRDRSVNSDLSHDRVVGATRRDGASFPMEIAVGDFMDSDGKHFTAIMRDISSRVAAEEALRASEERLELALMGADLGSWDWNCKTGEAVFNERWASMLGYSLAELNPSYASWASRIHPEDQPRVMAALKAHKEGRTDYFQAELRLQTKSGGWCWVQSRGRVFQRDAQGNPLRAAGTHMDISERKELEEQLLRQQADLLHAQRLTTAGELAATMAHELNQPLAAITNYIGGASLRYANLLEANPGLRQIMVEVQRLSQRAAEIILGIRGLVRKHETGRQWADLGALVQEVLSLVQPEVEKRRIAVSADLGEIPLIFGQRVHLQQLLLNLVMNAIDAMEAPSDRQKRLDIRAWKSGPKEVTVTVCDTGVGIPPDLAQNIFEPFISSKPHGIGLGLSICRTIAEAHGGRIAAYSAGEGQGACFTVNLPVEDGEKSHANA